MVVVCSQLNRVQILYQRSFLDPIFSRILGPFRGGPQFQGVRQLWNESFSMVVVNPKGNLLAKFERNRRDGPAQLFWFSQTCSLKRFTVLLCDTVLQYHLAC